MRKKLLSLVALAGAMFVSTSAFAQWAEPTAPALQEVNATEVESGKTYYIKNVGAGQFITGANSWNTQISLTVNGINDAKNEAIAILVTDTTMTLGNNAVTGVTLSLNGSYTFNGVTRSNTCLFRHDTDGNAGVGGGFVDYNNQGHGVVWKITKATSGYWYIQVSEGDTYFADAATQYAGWDNSLGEIESDPETGELLDGSVSTAVQFNMTGELESECIEWMFIPAEEFFAQKEAYNYRVKLYEKYLETVETAEAEGLDVDMSGAEAIYNNPNATIAELESAIADLSYQVNVAIFNKELEGASPDAPIEATDICLINPAFEDGNIGGWKCTFVSGQTANNVGFQGANYTNNGSTLTENGSAVNDDDASAYLNRFIEAWRDNGQDPHHIGDAELSQTVYGLPTGVYKLTCDVISVQQGSYFPNPVTGVKLFIATDTGKEVFQEVATSNNNPEHFSVTFTCPEGVRAMTFGLKTENTTANWIAADNFRIYYYGSAGDLVPEMLILMDQVKAAEEAGYTADDNANAEVLSNYIDALDAANAIIGLGSAATAEQCENATAILKAAFDAAKQSIKDYVNLWGYIEEAETLSSNLMEAGFADAAEAVEELLEDWETAYEDKTATKEMIDTLAGVAHATMIEHISTGRIPEGTDITFLIENPDFETLGPNNKTVPGWTVVSGSITDHSVQYHNIEGYHTTFDLRQTLKNMPAGVYDITVQGFVANEGTQNCELYAGSSVTSFKEIKQEYSMHAILSNGTDDDMNPTSTGAWPYDRVFTLEGTGETAYTPNSMQGAKMYFETINPLTDEPFYTNHAKILLTESGDLNIGVRTTGGSEWILWDNFKIKYIGMDTEPLIAALNEQLNELNGLINGDDTHDAVRTTKRGQDSYATLSAEAKTAIDNDDADAIMAKIQEVIDAIAYVKAGDVVCEALASLVDEYNSYAMDIVSDEGLEPTDENFPAMLEEYAGYDIFETDFSDFADNEAVETAIQALRDGWVPYILSAATEATALDPVDVTLAVTNANYVNFAGETSVAGWTEAEDKFSTGNIEAGVAEFYTQNFNLSQTINGLTPGFYMVTVDGFYRAGFPAAAAEAQVADTMAHNAVMYATSTIENKTKRLVDIFAGAQPEAYAGESEVTANILVDGEETPVYIPNMRSSAAVYFETGAYTNTVWVEVGEDGVLTIGLRKNALIDGDWTPFNNWRLYYCGTTLPDAVKSIDAETATAAGKSIFNLAGQKVSKAQKGIYIIGGRKVVVK